MAVVNPSVACVMLATGNRHQMRGRAIRAFEAQTYPCAQLLVYPSRDGVSIGELRNEAISETTADIIVHADDDDYSAPQRIEEQVRLLEASGAEAVGYNEVLFWDTSRCTHCAVGGEALKDGAGTGWHCVSAVLPLVPCPSLAYLYSNPRPNYAIGASLAFWRSTWLRRPFPHLPEPGNKQCGGEDAAWLEGVRCVAGSAFAHTIEPEDAPGFEGLWRNVFDEADHKNNTPRLICSIHGDQSQRYDLALQSPQFRRASQFDDFARERMKL